MHPVSFGLVSSVCLWHQPQHCSVPRKSAAKGKHGTSGMDQYCRWPEKHVLFSSAHIYASDIYASC
ncbi:hypothetical protein IscW_ISCW022007 [Ixodes scapularis]|uniref:Uncharacterized protein n=1 Tax=Ixodes scapularis TaxID=6945 RepID=B7QAV3_IXOSC|nr:hypothetical protein IscW_ISCW022007 [Ixodes scapularis]|eukprot:XP_002412679.1 hypothetical protein IscW_ISCW022007 [Ixodes scapularis]